MAPVKREAGEEGELRRRVRGKARQGGDIQTLLEQHSLRAVRVLSTGWPDAGTVELGEEEQPQDVKQQLQHMVSLAHLPLKTQLMDIGWHGKHETWEARPVLCTSAGHSPLASVQLSVQTHDQTQALALTPHNAVSVPEPTAEGRYVHLLDAGGHVYDLAWARQRGDGPEWLAVACAQKRDASSTLGGTTDADGVIEIWKMLPGDIPRLQLVMEHEAGTPFHLAWRPSVPVDDSVVGTLAVSYSDATVRLMDIPNLPENDVASSRVRATARTSLHVPGTACYSLAWGGPTRLAVGCSNGHVAIWELNGNEEAPAPLVDAPLHDTLVSSLAWQMLPPLSVDGIPWHEGHPDVLCSVGWDGTELVSHMEAMYTPMRLAHSREPRYAVAWSPWIGGWVLDLGDHQFGTVSLRTWDAGQHHALGFHHGRVLVCISSSDSCLMQSVATSAMHPYVATGAADGTVKLTNALAVTKRHAVEDGSRVRALVGSPLTQIMHVRSRILRDSEERYTLRHGFFPEGVWPRGSMTKSAPLLYDAWDASVAITSVAWSPNPGRALLLASGSALGIVRVEWAEGRGL